MTALRFEGPIAYGDDCRVSYGEDELDGSIHIGGRDVVMEVLEARFSGRVTVGVADSTFDGNLFVEAGWGYSEFTPMDPDTLKVGDRDLVSEISSRFGEGDVVTLWISDEPIDLLNDGREA